MWYGNITKDLEDLGNGRLRLNKIDLVNERIEEYQEKSIQRELAERLDAIQYDKSGLDRAGSRGRTNLKKRLTEEEDGYGYL